MLVCFENDLVKDWPRIAHTIRDMSKVSEARQLYWNFIDFLVSQRSPVFVLLLPFISQKVKFYRMFKKQAIAFLTINCTQFLIKLSILILFIQFHSQHWTTLVILMKRFLVFCFLLSQYFSFDQIIDVFIHPKSSLFLFFFVVCLLALTLLT